MFLKGKIVSDANINVSQGYIHNIRYVLYLYDKTALHCNNSQGIPTVMGASAIGYVLGKTTYKGTMEDRFLNELPDSNVAKHIRIKRKLEPPR